MFAAQHDWHVCKPPSLALSPQGKQARWDEMVVLLCSLTGESFGERLGCDKSTKYQHHQSSSSSRPRSPGCKIAEKVSCTQFRSWWRLRGWAKQLWKNNLVTITIRGGFQLNQDQIMGPLMTISIDKDIISLIAPVPSSHCQSCWGGGGDSLAEDHLTPWLAGSTSCKKLTTQNQTALSYITLIYLHALAAYCL